VVRGYLTINIQPVNLRLLLDLLLQKFANQILYHFTKRLIQIKSVETAIYRVSVFGDLYQSLSERVLEGVYN
jgi:hypothetical protein